MIINEKGNKKFINPIYFKGMVGSLRYLISPKSNIVYGVGIISKFIKKKKLY